MTSISFIIPTVGRPTLKRAIDSLIVQVNDGDEIIVVGDGPQPKAKAICAEYQKHVAYFEHGPTFQFGHAQRNFGTTMAKGAYLAFLDDDDFYVPNALYIMRTEIDRFPDKILIFRCNCYGKILWRSQEIKAGNVGTSMVVIPNIKERLGVWQLNPTGIMKRGGDSIFVKETVSKWPEGSVVWLKDVLVQAPKAGLGKRMR